MNNPTIYRNPTKILNGVPVVVTDDAADTLTLGDSAQTASTVLAVKAAGSVPVQVGGVTVADASQTTAIALAFNAGFVGQ